MRTGTYLQITKHEWYALGGFSNNRLFRRMRSGQWRYFMEAR